MASIVKAILAFSFVIISTDAACQIKLDERPGIFKYHPMIWSQTHHSYPVNGSRILTIGNNEKIGVSCHGTDSSSSYLVKDAIPGLDKDEVFVQLSCKKSKFFYRKSGRPTDVAAVVCSGNQQPAIKKSKQKCASVGADGRTWDLDEHLHVATIGWSYSGHFIEQIRVCLDEKVFGSIWVKHSICGPSVALRDQAADRAPFRTDTSGNKRFFNHWSSNQINNAYKSKAQIARMVHLLGSNKLYGTDQVIINDSPSSNFYLARGHLAPDSDFIFDPQQDASYYFVNVAPQFQSFNNGNWKLVENAARSYAQWQQIDVDVYTGTLGILQYRNSKSVLTNITLIDYKGEDFIPVPKYYWKVIYNPDKVEAIFIIGLNDPYAKAFDESFCKSVCSKTPGIPKSYNNAVKGLLQCCPVNEQLKSLIPALPDLTDSNGSWPSLIHSLRQKPLMF